MAKYTPDRNAGQLIEDDSIQLRDRVSATGQTGTIYRKGDDLYIHDSVGELNLRTGGSGITEGQHEALDTLVHEVAEDAYLEVVRSGGKVVDMIYWTDSGKTVKIRETNITRSAGKVSQIVRKHYDGAGVIITGQTLTGTVSRTSGQVSSIDWAET